MIRLLLMGEFQLIERTASKQRRRVTLEFHQSIEQVNDIRKSSYELIAGILEQCLFRCSWFHITTMEPLEINERSQELLFDRRFFKTRRYSVRLR